MALPTAAPPNPPTIAPTGPPTAAPATAPATPPPTAPVSLASAGADVAPNNRAAERKRNVRDINASCHVRSLARKQNHQLAVNVRRAAAVPKPRKRQSPFMDT